MGCSSSKTAQAKAAQAGAPVAALPEAPLLIPEGDFKINLENATCSEDLGIEANFPQKKYIVVDSVREVGLIPAWNKGKENTPELQVKAGDSIVVINGVFGDSDLMLAEVKSKEITLVVKSGQAATGQAEEATGENAANPVVAVLEASSTEPAAANALTTEGPTPELSASQVVDDGVVAVEPEAAEVGASVDEERFCKLAMC
jgi:hypothetical protein